MKEKLTEKIREALPGIYGDKEIIRSYYLYNVLRERFSDKYNLKQAQTALEILEEEGILTTENEGFNIKYHR